MSALPIAEAAGASRRAAFLVTDAAFASASSASSAFMYTTSSASSSGARTSRILSLKIALAAVMSSVMTVPLNDHAPRKARSAGTVAVEASI